MVEAVIVYPGLFVDKPNTTTIRFDLNDIAMEKKDEATGKFMKITVGELYTLFVNRQSLIRENINIEDMIDHTYFETWFYEKHIKGKPYHNRILKLTFNSIT